LSCAKTAELIKMLFGMGQLLVECIAHCKA